MICRLLGFFSGFPDCHFTNAVITRLNKELTLRDSLVFISAWPADYAKNDDDLAGMYELFSENGMFFEHQYVIDNRTDADFAKAIIKEASCVFLMGGHPGQQIKLIHDKGLDRAIRDAAGAVLGLSAGAINMAAHSLDTKDSPVPYDGLGLADITVKPHFEPDNPQMLSELSQISMKLPIYAMTDNSAIFVKGGDVTYEGRIFRISGGKIHPVS